MEFLSTEWAPGGHCQYTFVGNKSSGHTPNVFISSHVKGVCAVSTPFVVQMEKRWELGTADYSQAGSWIGGM